MDDITPGTCSSFFSNDFANSYFSTNVINNQKYPEISNFIGTLNGKNVLVINQLSDIS